MASATLWRIYAHASPAQRLLASLRPYICPVAPLLAPIRPGSNVLDIGCGNGLILALLASFGDIRQGQGVEINERAIAAAESMARANGFPTRFEVIDDLRAWPAGPFDVVSMVDVLHHVPKPLRQTFVMEAMARVAPGGIFLYKDMADRPWWRVAWNALHDLVLARQRVHTEPVENVMRWGIALGLEPRPVQAYVACGLYGHELLVFDRPSGAGGVRGPLSCG
jgi:2-polyprenyl-3-methyl-5-hydroxy-6-metoxy-1,4-benzoquinol methylase